MWGSGRGAGRGLGEGPCAGAAPPLRAAQPPPSPPGAAASTSAPPSPSQSGDTALDDAKEKGHTEVKLLEKCTPAYFAAQVGRTAPRRAATSSAYPHPSLERGTKRPVPRAPSLWSQPYNALPIVYALACSSSPLSRP